MHKISHHPGTSDWVALSIKSCLLFLPPCLSCFIPCFLLFHSLSPLFFLSFTFEETPGHPFSHQHCWRQQRRPPAQRGCLLRVSAQVEQCSSIFPEFIETSVGSTFRAGNASIGETIQANTLVILNTQDAAWILVERLQPSFVPYCEWRYLEMVFDEGRKLHWCLAIVGEIEKIMEEGPEGSEDGSLRHKTV